MKKFRCFSMRHCFVNAILKCADWKKSLIGRFAINVAYSSLEFKSCKRLVKFNLKKVSFFFI